MKFPNQRLCKGTVSSESKSRRRFVRSGWWYRIATLPPDDLYENKIDFTAKKAPAPTPAVVLPNMSKIESTPAPSVELPKPVSEPITQQVNLEQTITPVEAPVETQQEPVITTEPENQEPVKQEVESEPVAIPTPAAPSRIGLGLRLKHGCSLNGCLCT